MDGNRRSQIGFGVCVLCSPAALLTIAKIDHLAYVKRIAAMLAGGEQIAPGSLAA